MKHRGSWRSWKVRSGARTNRQGIRHLPLKCSDMTAAAKRLALLLNVVVFVAALASPGASIALAAEAKGTASKVVDGDTLWVCSHSACIKVRLCGIDAPELSDPGGEKAKSALQSLVSSKVVTCVQVGAGTPCDGRSRPTSYDRIVAQCFVRDRDLAAAMVDTGHACDWVEFSGGFYSQRGHGARCGR